MDISPIAAQFAQAIASARSSLGESAAATGAAGSVDAGAAAPASASFGGAFDQALRSISGGQQQANQLQQQFQLENPEVSLEDTMVALNKSQLSFQAAVQVRNKLVQAYDQIMQMPV